MRKGLILIFVIIFILLLSACEVDNNEIACVYNGRIREDLDQRISADAIPDNIQDFENEYIGNIKDTKHLTDEEFDTIKEICFEFLTDNYRINYVTTSAMNERPSVSYKLSSKFVQDSKYVERMDNLKKSIIEKKADLNIDSIEFSKSRTEITNNEQEKIYRYYFRVNWMYNNPFDKNIDFQFSPDLINGYNYVVIILYYKEEKGLLEIIACIEHYEDPYKILFFSEENSQCIEEK